MQSIQFKRTQTAGKKPTPEQLQVGEIAIQMADHVIYTKDKNNAVVQVSVSPESHNALNTKVDNNKKTTDATIAANKTEAANNLASAKAELNQTITTKDTATNKRIDATNTTVSNLTQTVTANKTDADTKINNLTGTVASNKSAIETTVANNKRDADNKIAALTTTVNDNNTAINNKVNTTNTNVSNLTKTVTANKTDADNKISSLTSTVAANKTAIEKVVSDNKKDADTKISNLTGTVNSNHTAINAKVDKNKTDTDSAIAAANRRIDGIEGSNDALYIKKNTNTYHHGYLLTKTANYLEDQTARDLNYFGAFRTNGQDGLMDLTLNVPHSAGKAHGRGFTFRYGTGGSRVETYGFDVQGQKAFSYKMYHEGDKPTPGEIGAYTKAEVDKMFIKNVRMTVPSGDATRGYFKIATATIPQNGRMVMLRIFGGNGYNVNSYDQVDFVEIVIRSGNNNPKGVSIAAYRRNALNVHQVFAVNTSGDNYDIYVNYGRYTDNVIVEYGKTDGVTLTVHDVPELTLVKPSVGVTDARVITMFNTENKAGTLMFDNNSQATYDIVSLSNAPDNNRNYLRKFRSRAAETIWHETVQGDVYRLATGATDQKEVLKIVGSDGLFVNRLHLQGNNAIRMWRPTGRSNYFEYMDQRNGANKRQGWFGFGSTETNDFQWYSDEGQNFVKLDASGQVSLNTGATKIVYTNGQYYSANSDAYRMIYGNYGAFWRNDGTKVYLLSTAENDKFGGWNTYRPFIYDLTSGNVQLGGDGNEEALTLERASRAARFSNDVYIKKGHLTFDAGRLGSRDFFKINHWGDSNNARDNILQFEDSQGAHFTTERAMGTGNITARFKGFVRVESGEIAFDANRGSASQFSLHTWGNEQRKQVFECKDATSYHWYTERTAGGTGPVKFSVAGSFHSGSDVNVGGSLNFGNAIQRGGSIITIASSSAGAGSFASQHDDNVKAPIFQRLDRGDASVYVPLIKQRYVQGAVTFSLGMLINEGSWRVHVKGSGVESNTTFYKNGDFQAGRNGNFNDVYIRSDARLKINKEEYKENATDKVNRLTVYTYDKVKSLTDRTVIAHEVGIIAQDLEKELPEAVSISNIGDPDKPEEILTISNSAVNALLIKAFQEMSAKFDAMAKELAETKAELAELKATK
ncbi:TPA: tail fiber domain-containing protein [Shigella sonnei]|uniref:phage tail fiber protein n=1 Tax=Escherichia coli TaxID=562 RepID=UPI00176E153E|nr:tail fiber domain-containing protein [Escherichia coli]HDX0321887.1 tail fiber domain-containing protein [Shigella sonnei]HAH7135017.1 tail fiber domain-containing protein [Escherichia coli]HAJ8743517.1 tail fiber domain-containing protein [Escherichia coli]HDX0361063.1 tail fiber domain-containing protein [Shigella sonnei]HDX0374241.1 tail fiber domain-containing protein [Shigella sonnei]